MIETKINYKDIFKTDNIEETINEIKKPKSIRQIYNELGHFGFTVIQVKEVCSSPFNKGEEYFIEGFESYTSFTYGKSYQVLNYERQDEHGNTWVLNVDYCKLFILTNKGR